MALTARTLCSADEQTRARAVKKLSGVGSIGWKVFRFFLLCGLCFVLLYPLLYMLSISFRSMKDIYDPSVIWVSKHWTMDNFKEVIEVMDYKRGASNVSGDQCCQFADPGRDLCGGRLRLCSF